jgi:putative membrane protein
MKVITRGLVLAATAALLLPLVALAEEGKKVVEKRDPARQPQTDKEFLAKALASEIAEVKFGEHAKKHADSKEVRDFAQRMIDDHTKMRDNLLRQAKSMKLAVVEGLEPDYRDAMKRLSRLKGSEYDRVFIGDQLVEHEKARELYEAWSKKATDSELRDLATKAVSTVKDHIRRARALQGKQKKTG